MVAEEHFFDVYIRPWSLTYKSAGRSKIILGRIYTSAVVDLYIAWLPKQLFEDIYIRPWHSKG